MQVNTIRCRECDGYAEIQSDVWPLTIVGSALCKKCLRAKLTRTYTGTKSMAHIAGLYPHLRLLDQPSKVQTKRALRTRTKHARRDKSQAKPMGRH